MLNTLFPKIVTNDYKGSKIASWILYFYIFKSFFSGSIHMFSPDGGAQTIASIPLDTFTQGGANSLVTLFGLWGMEQFVIGLIALVIVTRYRSLIPFMTGIYAIEYLGRFATPLFTPGLVSIHQPPGAIADKLLVPLAIGIFIWALISSHKAATNESNHHHSL